MVTIHARFLICVSVLIAISILGGFHFYLLLTNQSTIEFQINTIQAREDRKNGLTWHNPYSLGCLKNVQQVMCPNGAGIVYAFFPWSRGLFRQHEAFFDPYAGVIFPKPGNFVV